MTKVCSYLKTGADIGYTGSRTARFYLPTALALPEIVSENLTKEVSLGREAAPFSTPPFPNLQVSPIGLAPKKHSTKFRAIFHLSFPKSGVTSINYSISKEDHSLQYITIDNAIERILHHGRGCFLAKTDIESAFRLIPLKPSLSQPDYISCQVKISKTDPFQIGHTILIGKTNQPICPVKTMKIYLATKTNIPRPLFQYQSGSLLTKDALTYETRSLLAMSEVNRMQYAGRNYRIEATITAASVGLPPPPPPPLFN